MKFLNLEILDVARNLAIFDGCKGVFIMSVRYAESMETRNAWKKSYMLMILKPSKLFL